MNRAEARDGKDGRSRPLTRLRALLLALPGALMLLAGAAAAQDVAGLQTVRLQLKWLHQFQFAGYYAAQVRGYYRDAGLNVEIIEARPGEEPMQAVVDGKADFGVGTTDLLLMRSQGVPVVVLADVFQHSPLALMVLDNSGLDNLHEVARRRVMIEPHSAELFAYFTEEGVASDRLNLVEHSFDPAALLDGRVDAMSVYVTDEPFTLERQGVRYRLMRPIHSGIDFYGDNLFTMQGQIDRNPEQVRAFVAASMKGWDYAMSHPQEIARLITQRYGTRKSLSHLLFEAEAMRELVLPDVVPTGYVNPARWERIAETYARLGMVPARLDLDGFIWRQHVAEDDAEWIRLVAVLSVVALVLAGLIGWYIRLTRRLRAEVVERERAQERLERLNRQKNMLFSVIGHDLRTPFNVLMAYGEILVAQGPKLEPERLGRIAQSISEASNAAYRLLSQLLDWASLQMLGEHAEPERVVLADMIRDVAGMLRPLADAKHILLEQRLDEGLAVRVEPRTTATVLRNFLGNAVKFTPEGGTITIDASRDGTMAVIAIADTGVGIAPDRLKTMFDAGERHTSPGTQGETGTGFGLILSREFLEMNGGSMDIASVVGTGTTVTVRLPLDQG